jgi:hypothetical protein
MRGGSGSYSSASSYGQYVAGSPDVQFSNTFNQNGPYGNVPGNSLIGQQGQGLPSSSQMPSSSQLQLIQNGGRRTRRHKRHRGGFLGEVINQAIVPFGLLGLQQSYHRKKGGSHRSRRSRRN